MTGKGQGFPTTPRSVRLTAICRRWRVFCRASQATPLVGDVAAGYESGDAEAFQLGVGDCCDAALWGKNGFTRNTSVDSGGEVTGPAPITL